MHVLARGTAQRLVDLEQVQLNAAIQRLSPQQSLTVLAMEFLLHDQPGGVAMSKWECAHWLRRGMPPTGLPRRLRPVLDQARDMARRFCACVDRGEPAPEDLTDFCVWLLPQDAAAGAWGE